MANPLARVIMTNLVDMDNGGANRSSSTRSNSQVSSDVNLSPNEENLLLDLIGGTSKVSGGRSEVAKGYSRNSGSSVKGIQSLASLAGDSVNASSSSKESSSYGEKASYGQKSNSYGQKSSYGVKTYSSDSGKSGAGVKALSLDQLAGNNGASSSDSGSYVSAPVKERQQGTNKSGMVTLEGLAGDKLQSSSSSSSSSNSSNSSVRSTVITNLEGISGYVPKVSLGSIGKGSRF